MKRLICFMLAIVIFVSMVPATVNAAGQFKWPLPTQYGITTGYTAYANHNGVDMAAPQGTPIYANFSGTAIFYQIYTTINGVKYLTSYGNSVYLTSTDGMYWAVFAHMNAFNGFNLQIPSSQTKRQSGNTGKIELGRKTVNVGDLLGYVGTTGNSTGNHLHYGLKVNGTYVNPTSYLDQSVCAGSATQKPTNPWITASASAVVAGSGTVTINCGADHATNYTVGIDRLGTGRVVTQELSGPTYTTSFNQGGIYRIYVTCYNSAGYADTSAVFVTVYHDLGTDFTAPILNKGHWKPIENAYNSGYKVQLATETGFANQLWYFERQSDGSYKISSCYDGRCLDVKDASNQPDATVQTHPSNDNAAQRWYIWEEAGGYVLKPKCSDCVLDLTDNESADGTNIITYTYHGGAPQIWSIYRGEECILKSPSMTVSPGDSKSATTFTWGNVYGARNYNVKIWKGTAWDGEQFAGANNVTSGYSVVLPAGTYQAYVDAVHQFGCKMSNLVTFTVKEHTHSNTYKVTKSPTTSATGTLTGTCSKCSGTTTVTLPKLNTNDYSYTVTKAATCTAAGTGRYTWKTTTYGSFYFDVSIAAKGHSYTTKVTAPTCTAQGYTTYTCACGHSYKDNYTSATGHSYSYKVTKSPTTSATGTLTGTCSKCSGTTTVTLPKLNTSDYSYAVTKAATCTATGTGRYTWKTTTYGSFYFDVSITATGHTYTSKVTAPTCTEQGYTTHTCICGDSYVDSYTEALGHNYVDGVCTGCGAQDQTPDVIASGSCGANVTWTLTADGTLSLNGTGSMTDYANAYAPWHDLADQIDTVVMSEGITNIGQSAFMDCVNLTSVTIPDTVRLIWYGAFWNCSSLKSIDIPESVYMIRERAFMNCTSLEQIELPDGISRIWEYAFYGCTGLTSVKLPSSLTRIDMYAFENCTSLAEVNLPESLTIIESCAFKNCDSLIEIIIPAIETLGNNVFENCDVLTKAAFSKGLARVSAELFKDCASLDTILIPDSVTEIGHGAFMGCQSLEMFHIPEAVTAIGYNAFSDCIALRELVIPDSVKTIGASALENCDGITTVYIPDSVVSMGNAVFKYCSELTEVRLPGGLTEIGQEMFYYCVKLRSVEIPSGVSSIGYRAFCNCQNLMELILPNSLTYIGPYAFSKCCALDQLVIPEGVTKIDNYAFFQAKIASVFFMGDAPNFGTEIFREFSGKVYYPIGNVTWTEEVMDSSAKWFAGNYGYCGKEAYWTLDEEGVLRISGVGRMTDYAYKSQMPWYAVREDISKVVIKDGIINIGNFAFYGMPNLQSVDIADGLTQIGDYAFKNCANLHDVVLPETLSQLGDSAFYACTSLTSIEIPAKLYTIKAYTFKNCTNLTEVIFNEGNLQKISDGAFYNTGLTELVLPDCLDILDVYAFKNCSKLTSIELGNGLKELREAVFYGTAIPGIEIPEGITRIGPYAFKNCVKLVNVELPESLTSVGEASFYACTALERLALPDAVTKIGNYAFRKCGALVDVQFGAGLTNIGESSFYGCEKLVYLAIPGNVTTIQGYAFKGCTDLEIVELPESLKTVGDSAFHTCTSLSEITIPGGVTKIGEYCFSGSTGIDQITFEGNAPAIGAGTFNKITATAYYPEGNTTWTSANKLNYGGKITWRAQ